MTTKIHVSQKSFPTKVKNFPTQTFVPTYTKHAKNAAKNDRYGHINLPNTVTFNGSNIFEVEMEGDNVVKACIRISYNNSKDIVIVAMKNWVIKTVWLNDKNDNHKSLNINNYD